MSNKALALSLLFLQALPTVAFAQEDEGGFIEEEEEGGKRRRRGKAEDAGAVREIVRGFYAKTNVGGAAYLGSFSQVVNAGSFVGLSVGQDFVDTERQSMAWEVALQQGLHNGTDIRSQADSEFGCRLNAGLFPCTEGDLRTYTVAANYEISFYPTRRLGVGARAGAGVLFSPHLIESAEWEEVVQDVGGDPTVQGSPKPVVFGGPTMEYYTKLSHFSVGLDVDVFYGIGWDLGLNASGHLKYTF